MKSFKIEIAIFSIPDFRCAKEKAGLPQIPN
jgi:hypothetical protein